VTFSWATTPGYPFNTRLQNISSEQIKQINQTVQAGICQMTSVVSAVT
jgi:hypothetical protein